MVTSFLKRLKKCKQLWRLLHLMEAAGFYNTYFKFLLNLQNFLESVDHPTLTCFFEFENLRF